MVIPYTKRHLSLKQLGNEPRVTFKVWVTDSDNLKDIDNGHEEDMTIEDVAIVDKAFRECLQVLDVVLVAPRNDYAFNAYFKDYRYRYSIFGKQYNDPSVTLINPSCQRNISMSKRSFAKLCIDHPGGHNEAPANLQGKVICSCSAGCLERHWQVVYRAICGIHARVPAAW